MPPIAAMSAEHLREFPRRDAGQENGSSSLGLRTNAPATVNQHYRSIKRFHRWLLEQGEVAENPMSRTRPPRVPDQSLALHPAFASGED